MSIFSQSTRRSFFTNAGLIGALGALPGGQRIAAAMAAKATQESMKVYTRLGLRPIINASGTYTHLGGSLLPEEVIDAMNDAAKHYVPIRDLVTATGERIAQLTGAPGALVTTGAAGSIFVGTAACIAGDDPEKMKRLPFTDGMKNEVVVQPLHVAGWTRQCEAAGARLTVAEYKDQMERAINGRTAMLYFLIADKHFGANRDVPNAAGGKVSLEECIEISKKTRIPILVDAAAELPPAINLSYYTRLGADLVAFSGGKGLRGPQNAGLLLGRRDLVEMAAKFQSPYSGSGRDL
jgi:seryl-tRNA(Sec) selenium transferase